MNILRTALIASVISFVSSKKTHKYPGYSKPRGGSNYPARLPRNQIVQAKPAQTLSLIRPTIPPRVVPEDSWDATVTQWISVIDPKRIVTETVTTDVTLAKLHFTKDDTFTETDDEHE